MVDFIKSFSIIKETINVKPKTVVTENVVFKFHYRLTFWILLVSTLLVCSRQYIGEHIRCLRGGKYLPEQPIETFCFFTGTYTIVKNVNASAVQRGIVPHPGVGPKESEDDEVIIHAYYQWVPFILFFQAICFYLPYFLWKQFEGGRMDALCTGLSLLDAMDAQKRGEKIDTIHKTFKNRLHIYKPWGSRLVLCEMLNLINLILQMWLTDWFLGGKFFSLGPRVVQYNGGDVNPLDEVFPKVTKCNFYKYGASGSIQYHDILCVMALNVINEKIYVFLWFWFLLLSIMTLCGLIWRLISFLFHRKLAKFNKIMFATASAMKMNREELDTVCKNTDFRDWLFLSYIALNINGRLFREVLSAIAADLSRVDEVDSSTDGTSIEFKDTKTKGKRKSSFESSDGNPYGEASNMLKTDL